MGTATCEKCGTAAEVIDQGKPWKCPACGRVNGEATWQKIGSGISGLALVIVGVVVLVVIVAVVAALA